MASTLKIAFATGPCAQACLAAQRGGACMARRSAMTGLTRRGRQRTIAMRGSFASACCFGMTAATSASTDIGALFAYDPLVKRAVCKILIAAGPMGYYEPVTFLRLKNTPFVPTFQ